MSTRREFIAAGAAAAFLSGCRSVLPRGEYSVPLLGDVHYDRPPIDVFHSEFRRLHADDGMFARYRAEFESFSSMWGTGGRSAALVAASGKTLRPDAAFALQLGDLVEGDCESPALHERMMSDAFALMKRTYGENLPFVTVAGNHDVRRGADRLGEYDAYCRMSAAWHAKELGVDVAGPTFAFWQGPDLWVVADFNRPDSRLVEQLLLKNGPSRYTFFCTHGAVLTTGTRSLRRWFFLGGPQYDANGRSMTAEFGKPHPEWDEARRRIRRILAERHAIVLSGHSHLLELRDWFGDGGRITEFVMNSVTKTAKGVDVPDAPVVVGSRPEDFGRCRRSPNAKPNDFVESLYAEYEPGVRRYYTANAAGHAQLRISDSSVVAEFFPGSALVPCETFNLRGLHKLGGCISSDSGRAGLRLMTYNIRHCRGSDGNVDVQRIAGVIARESPDFVGLNEVDQLVQRSGGIAEAEELGRLTGFHATFAEAIPLQGGSYGNAVLSRERPLSVERIPLPGKEPRVLLLCEFEGCWFGTTHLDLKEEFRRKSVEIIRGIVEARAAAKSVFLTGDWNATPESAPLIDMKKFMTVLSTEKHRTYHGYKDYVSDSEQHCIDYIAVDSAHAVGIEVKECHVTKDVVSSDHNPVFVCVK